MNEFKKVIKDDKLYLVVTTKDDSGNVVINHRFCKDEAFFNSVKEDIISTLQGKLNESKIQLEKLPQIVVDIEEQLNQINNL